MQSHILQELVHEAGGCEALALPELAGPWVSPVPDRKRASSITRPYKNISLNRPRWPAPGHCCEEQQHLMGLLQATTTSRSTHLHMQDVTRCNDTNTPHNDMGLSQAFHPLVNFEIVHFEMPEPTMSSPLMFRSIVKQDWKCVVNFAVHTSRFARKGSLDSNNHCFTATWNLAG